MVHSNFETQTGVRSRQTLICSAEKRSLSRWWRRIWNGTVSIHSRFFSFFFEELIGSASVCFWSSSLPSRIFRKEISLLLFDLNLHGESVLTDQPNPHKEASPCLNTSSNETKDFQTIYLFLMIITIHEELELVFYFNQQRIFGPFFIYRKYSSSCLVFSVIFLILLKH